MNWNELSTLCSLCGTSGREHEVREYILTELKKLSLPADAVQVDRLGNVLVHKKGAEPAKHKVMFSAHMDEVALMVTSVNGNGSLSFDSVGGVNAAAVIGRQVLAGRQKVSGVIGSKPVHLLSKDARSRPAEMSRLFCDIGTGSAEETRQFVREGDIIYFPANAQEIGEDTFLSKAIDDRFGCAVLLDMIRSGLPCDTDFAFVVQEEVGLRGAGPAAAALEPEIAVVLEATTAADLPDSDGAERVCELGKGAVLSVIDGRTVYDKELFDLAVAVCGELNIRWQIKKKIAGGNDAGAIQTAGKGARVMGISVPCRYLHAPCSVIRKSDAEECEKIAFALISALQEKTV